MKIVFRVKFRLVYRIFVVEGQDSLISLHSVCCSLGVMISVMWRHAEASAVCARSFSKS